MTHSDLWVRASIGAHTLNVTTVWVVTLIITLSMAGRPSKDISRYKEEIIDLIDQGLSYSAIVSHLANRHDTQIGLRTLERRCKDWGIQRIRKPVDSPQLRARISTLFYQCCLQDKDILHVLKCEGYSIHPKTLRRIRVGMGLHQRISPFNQDEAKHRLFEVVQKELDKGYIEGLGRSNLHAYFRSNMHIVSRYVTFFLIASLIITLTDMTNI